MSSAIIDEVMEELKTLPEEMQRAVLDFTRSLGQGTPRGVPGKDLVRFAGTLSPADGRLMSEAIERACEQVDHGEW